MTQSAKKATEIVQFKTLDSVSGDELLSIIDTLDRSYLRTLDAYVDSELISGPEDHAWTLVIHWRTLEEAAEAIKAFPQSPLTGDFRSIMDMKSIQLHFSEQVQTWGAAS